MDRVLHSDNRSFRHFSTTLPLSAPPHNVAIQISDSHMTGKLASGVWGVPCSGQRRLQSPRRRHRVRALSGRNAAGVTVLGDSVSENRIPASARPLATLRNPRKLQPRVSAQHSPAPSALRRSCRSPISLSWTVPVQPFLSRRSRLAGEKARRS